MKRMLHISLFSMVIAGLLFVGSPANAQSDAVKSAREAVLKTLSDIQVVETDVLLLPAEKEEKVLALKKTALSHLCTLSILETDELRLQLAETKFSGQSESFDPLRTDLIGRLSTYISFFKSIQSAVLQATTEEELGALADQFEEKRETVYNADIEKGGKLLLVLHIDTVLLRAFDRLDKIATAVKRTKTTRTEYAKRVSLLNEASIHLSEAKSSALAAHHELALYLLPETTEEEADVLPEPEAKETPLLVKPTIRELAENALTSTRKAYKNFIELSDALSRKR